MIKEAVLATVAAGTMLSGGLPAVHNTSAARAPAWLYVTGARAHSFRLAWDRVVGASGYFVQVRSGSGAVIRSFRTRQDRASVRGLNAGQRYTVRIRTVTPGSAAAAVGLRTSSLPRVRARSRARIHLVSRVVHFRSRARVRAGSRARVHVRPAFRARTRSLGQRIAAYARTFPGHAAYVWGGTGPRGFDCSGLALYVYRHFGYRLPRTAQEQFLHTRRVQKSRARPGDLVFFLSGGYAYHVGIYEGGDTMVAAATPETGVKYEGIYSPDVAFGKLH